MSFEQPFEAGQINLQRFWSQIISNFPFYLSEIQAVQKTEFSYITKS